MLDGSNRIGTGDFELLLAECAAVLTAEARSCIFVSSAEFEDRVRRLLTELSPSLGLHSNLTVVAGAFPDIALGHFGIEVKFTAGDSWRSVANSVLESTRSPEVTDIYLMYGKMGGAPEVRWARYEDSVIHVRTSHVPRFEVEIGATASLFEKFGVSYDEFSHLDIEHKMQYIRSYARGRLKDGEKLWWLESVSPVDQSLPLEVRLYMDLPSEEKRRLRAEGAILFPEIVQGSRVRNKYNDVAWYFLLVHGVFTPQTRDLYSAGSVAHRTNSSRGGIYIERALKDIEPEMISAADYLDEALFEEYWGKRVPRDRIIPEWLGMADSFAVDWVPSKSLFLPKEEID